MSLSAIQVVAGNGVLVENGATPFGDLEADARVGRVAAAIAEAYTALSWKAYVKSVKFGDSAL